MGRGEPALPLARVGVLRWTSYRFELVAADVSGSPTAQHLKCLHPMGTTLLNRSRSSRRGLVDRHRDRTAQRRVVLRAVLRPGWFTGACQACAQEGWEVASIGPDRSPELGDDAEPVPDGLTLDDLAARHPEVVGEEQVQRMVGGDDRSQRCCEIVSVRSLEPSGMACFSSRATASCCSLFSAPDGVRAMHSGAKHANASVMSPAPNCW
jgi:hypothetical protein